MAVQSTPYVETALSHTSELFRRELLSGLPMGSAGGVVPATPAASANATAGTAGCSDLQVTAPVSGMSVNVSAGQVLIPGSLGSGSGYGMGSGFGYPAVTLNGGSAPTIAATAHATSVQLTTQGAYYCYNDNSAGAVNLAIASSNPTNPRIDVVGAQVEDAAYSGSNNDWKLTVITGTAAASPTIPSFPANFVPLALVWVPAAASNIVAGDIVDLRVAFNRNPFRASMYRNVNLTMTTGVIAFDTVSYDVSNMITNIGTASAGFTVPVSGMWLFQANYRTTGATAGSIYFMSIGSQFVNSVSSGGTGGLFVGGSTTIPVSQGTTITVTANLPASTTLAGGAINVWASATLIAPL